MRSRILLISVVLLLAFVLVPVSNALIIADSVADFSGTQGVSGWTYEVLNNAVEYDMNWDAGNSEWTLDTTYSGVTVTMKQNATQMMKDKIGGGVMQGVGTIRRWTAPQDSIGDLTASGTYDIGYALTRVYSSNGYHGQPTAGGGTGSYSFNVGTLSAGDWVYVYTFCYNESASDPYDSVYQDINMVISGELVPEPATMCLLGLGGLLLRRRKR